LRDTICTVVKWRPLCVRTLLDNTLMIMPWRRGGNTLDLYNGMDILVLGDMSYQYLIQIVFTTRAWTNEGETPAVAEAGPKISAGTISTHSYVEDLAAAAPLHSTLSHTTAPYGATHGLLQSLENGTLSHRITLHCQHLHKSRSKRVRL
jgi:hypothetical protein